jgi:hypothetical protein
LSHHPEPTYRSLVRPVLLVHRVVLSCRAPAAL